MENQLKNPVFWGAVLFAGGIIVGGIGWAKNEAIETSVTYGAGVVIGLGIAMIIAGGVIMFTQGNRK